MERFLRLAEKDTFSYVEQQATLQAEQPSSYNVDRNRICLGRSEALFVRAQEALAGWRMFELGWVELIHPPAPIAPGQTVAIIAYTWGLYSLSASRVIAMIDEDTDGILRWGFSYGTLLHHVETGEERFTVEYHRQDDSVWYDILAFSRPRHPLARLGYPVSRGSAAPVWPRLQGSHAQSCISRAGLLT